MDVVLFSAKRYDRDTFVATNAGRHDLTFLDARLDGVYWYFVVGAWIPLYAVVFLVPRLR